MRHHDSQNTLHFVDPPYVAASRQSVGAYQHEMSDDDHRALAHTLRGLSGMVVLCGYPSTLYDELYADWPHIDRKAYADGARERTERLWFNPSAWAGRPSRSLLEVTA
jgi:DNA adenine methylase